MALKTRLLKTECLDCGYIARVTRTHLVRLGPLMCPCNGRAMHSDDWTEYQAAEHAADAAASDSACRVLREKWVTLRSAQECSRCRAELPHGEYCHSTAYTVGGEFTSEYTCAACHPETRSQYSVGAYACLAR